MQPVLQGYLGLLQGEKFASLFHLNNRETAMVISMASWIIIIKQKSTNGLIS